MLTDPIGQMVGLSTTSYQPTKAIWTQVVAEHTTCFRSACDTPSTASELDHRERWPFGRTTPENIWPGCKGDHKAKHAPGFSVEQDESGSFVLVTPAEFSHPDRAQRAPQQCSLERGHRGGDSVLGD